METPLELTGSHGIYFRLEDYASFWQRFLVDVVDLLAVILLWVIAAFAILLLGAGAEFTLFMIAASWTGIVLLYFVLLKRSAFRTLGDKLAGVKIIGTDGEPPSVGSMILWVSFEMLGPVNWLLDLAWLVDDPHRQTLRDKLAATYVVQLAALPIGRGKLCYRYCEVFLYNFLVREVLVETTRPI